MTAGTTPLVAAFYLPQFHAIPENDSWWSPGFTEWTNVRKAEPLYAGHKQPRVPGELGYYDLSDPEILHRQTAMARANGVGAFCFYHYWFSGGRRLLEKPVERYLADGAPDFPFFLCWANESWTRRWDGADSHILMKQEYRDEDPEAFATDLVRFFRDPRYVRSGGSPVFVVYRSAEIPELESTIRRWRAVWAGAGFPSVHLIGALTGVQDDPLPSCFDAAVEFPPHRLALAPLDAHTMGLQDFLGSVFDYREVIAETLGRPERAFPTYPCVTLAWDNTARKPKHGTILHGCNSLLYGVWLRTALARAAAPANTGHPLVFINAWNEWAEGTYLEPDTHHERAFLLETASSLRVHSGTASSEERLSADAADSLFADWAAQHAAITELRAKTKRQSEQHRSVKAKLAAAEDRLMRLDRTFTGKLHKAVERLKRPALKRVPSSQDAGQQNDG